MGMHILAAAQSNSGKVRDRNEDCFLLGRYVERAAAMSFGLSTQGDVFQRYGFIAAVADGVGGEQGGAEASRIALDTLSSLYYSETRDQVTEEESASLLERLLAQTQDLLVKTLARDNKLERAATTIAGIAMLPCGACVVYHAGDTRVLRLAAGFMDALTRDHSVAAAVIESGQLTEEQALGRPDARHLTSAMGSGGHFNPEINARSRFVPEDRLLLCTDGIYTYSGPLSKETLKGILQRPVSPTEVVAELIAAAHDVSRDNLTALVIDFAESERGNALLVKGTITK